LFEALSKIPQNSVKEDLAKQLLKRLSFYLPKALPEDLIVSGLKPFKKPEEQKYEGFKGFGQANGMLSFGSAKKTPLKANEFTNPLTTPLKAIPEFTSEELALSIQKAVVTRINMNMQPLNGEVSTTQKRRSISAPFDSAGFVRAYMQSQITGRKSGAQKIVFKQDSEAKNIQPANPYITQSSQP